MNKEVQEEAWEVLPKELRERGSLGGAAQGVKGKRKPRMLFERVS